MITGFEKYTTELNEFGFKQIREALANLNFEQLYQSVFEWIEE